MARQDDFTAEIKERLAKRVGMLCSNPFCRQPTSGPATAANKSVNIGAAAHITAASPLGARYDASMSTEMRRSIDNGIWCCQNCAKFIDNDAERFPVDTLKQWKSQAEEASRKSIEQPRNDATRNPGSDPMENVRCALIRNSLDFDRTLDSHAHTTQSLLSIEDREQARQFRGLIQAIFQDRDMVTPSDFGDRMSYLDSIEEALEELVQLDVELFCVTLPTQLKNSATGDRVRWNVANYFFVPKTCFFATSADVTEELVVHEVADNCFDGLKIWMEHIRYKKPIAFWDIRTMFNRPTMPTFCPVCCAQLLEIQRNHGKEFASADDES